MANELEPILTGIAESIEKVCTRPIPVRLAPLEGDLQGPVFFVTLVGVKAKPWSLDRERVSMVFNVRYHPSHDDDADLEILEAMRAQQAMCQALRRIYLPDGGKKGYDLSTEVVDGVAHAMVRYELVMAPVRLKRLVQGLELEYFAKKGD